MKLEPFPGTLRTTINHANHRPQLTPDATQHDWIVAAYNDTTISLAQIGKIIGASTGWVNKYCISLGMSRAPSRRATRIKEVRQANKEQKQANNKIIHADLRDIKPDKALLRSVHEEDEQPVIGQCMGENCVCYFSDSCYHMVKKPGRKKPVREHRTECNALF